ncbi:MAG TPA: methyl-accepting chemotaxis protein [Burkholderiaceae bacterium]|nr:methyl-accepting chemotaxis protein [Burkholderiaceae bacterium]
MKISHRLVTLAAFTSAGLVAVAAVGYFAVTSIQSDLRGLTMHATPLQNKTYEMQERTERALGTLLKLSLTTDRAEVERSVAVFDAELRELETLLGQIHELDPKAGGDLSEFRSAREQIAATVNKRLADDAAYRAETESARAALQQAEDAIRSTRAAVAGIETDAARAADQAQDASRGLGGTMKLVLSAQGKLKELALLVSETDAVPNRFHIAPLRERVKAQVDSVQRLEAQTGTDDPLKDVRTAVSAIYDAFTREGTGLFALRTDVLNGKKEAEEAYQKQRRAILGPIDDMSQKLASISDSLEVQVVKQRQGLDAALRFRNEPGGVVAVSDAISLDMKEMTAQIRLLMLATSEAEATAAAAGLKQLSERMTANVERLHAGLVKMNKPALIGNVNAASGALRSVSQSIGKVAETKKRLLASEIALASAMQRLKAVAAQRATTGATQVRSINERQQEITAAVDARVRNSLLLILAIGGAIIVASIVLSVRTVHVITARLNQAVDVAEAVSRGRLAGVPAAAGGDEMARLLTALGAMVATLTTIVGQIRGASDAINSGSTEISLGSRDLSSRTEQQASSLQQTTSTMQELTGTVRLNAESAREAATLAGRARGVAVEGASVVGRVVATMNDIQVSSKRIAEITAVIDGIAFQTNILALNAAVEAARAGEQGRGFAVVASEVRALAQRSTQAAQEIKSIIVASVDKVEAGSALVRDAGRTMDEIVSQVQRVTDLIGEISNASQSQFTSLGEVNNAVARLDAMTQRNAALAEQSAAAASTLCEQAKGLSEAVAVFQTSELAPA